MIYAAVSHNLGCVALISVLISTQSPSAIVLYSKSVMQRQKRQTASLILGHHFAPHILLTRMSPVDNFVGRKCIHFVFVCVEYLDYKEIMYILENLSKRSRQGNTQES